MDNRYRHFQAPGETRPFDVKKELDTVVGRYDEHPGEKLVVRALRILGRGLAGAAAAIAVAFVVMWVLHKHVRDAQLAPAPVTPGKPIPIQIIPAQ
jgi:hypothetical protein